MKMMRIKNTIDKYQIEMFSLDYLVSENYLVRDIVISVQSFTG